MAVAEIPTGMPYAVSTASSVQLARAHNLDLEMVPDRTRVPVSGLATDLDAGAIADKRSRLKRSLAQWPYYLGNSRVQ